MTLTIYLGTAAEIGARLAGPPNATTTTISAAASASVFTVASSATFSAGQSIVVGKQKAVIAGVAGSVITLARALNATPANGTTVRHYDADYTPYRDSRSTFSFTDDQKTGGNTGGVIYQDLILFDKNGLMPDPVEQNRITIFDEPTKDPLFAGVITFSKREVKTLDRAGNKLYQWLVEADGYQWEADSVGIEEQPFTNVNAGDFLQYLTQKWTGLAIGDIDTVNSPTIDFIRLSNSRRYSAIGQDLAALWPGSEFFIKNTHTGGAVYFRQAVTTDAPIVYNDSYINLIGSMDDQFCRLSKDYGKVYNIVLLPYYREQLREPDFAVQETVADSAFLKTSVVLAGQPSSLDESVLLFDDFSNDTNADFTEDDLSNPSPPTGYNSADGYMIAGPVNDVAGLNMLNTSSALPAARLGDIGRVTDPASVEPFTGQERQLIFIEELVINTLGDAVIGGIIDLTTRQTTTKSGSTTTRIFVNSVTGFSVDDRIDIAGVKAYISAIGSDYFDIYTAIGAPSAGAAVTLHRLAKSRINFGVYFKANGDLKFIKNGVETAFSTPRTYSAGPSTYSIRIYMQSFETTLAGTGISATGCTLNDATNFATGDVVDIYTAGSRANPERRVITKSGSNITYAATSAIPNGGYRIRTLPKITVEIKGGTEFGDITGRAWTTIYNDPNTWQTSATASPAASGVIMAINKSLVATMTLFQMKDPVPITANIGGRYLHIGTQEIDSSEADTDCIVRKVGSHFQLDFFPDTKALWASGTTLEMRYKERWKYRLEAKDIASIRDTAEIRGYTIDDTTTEQQMIRMGGRTLDTIELLPSPLTDQDAMSQTNTILAAVSSPAYTLEILSSTALHGLCKAGQRIKSGISGIPDMVIQRVDIQEMAGIKDPATGKSIYSQKITAGTVDRLSDILQRRTITAGSRLVLDDGISDDTFTRLQKNDFNETAETVETYTFDFCASPTKQIYDGVHYVALKCLLINN